MHPFDKENVLLHIQIYEEQRKPTKKNDLTLAEPPVIPEPEEPLHEPRFQSLAEESELPVHVVQESMNDLTLAEPPTV